MGGKFGLTELILLGFTSLLYFLPAFIAFNRKAADKTGILVLNLLTGWTGIGWVGSLIWACTGRKEFNAEALYYSNYTSKATPEPVASETVKPEEFGQRVENLQKLKGLLDSGIITEEEFNDQKNRILS